MNLLSFRKRKRVNCGWILAFFSSLILLGSGCSKEEYDLENLSTDSLLIKTALAAPIGDVKMTLNDIVKHDGIGGQITTENAVINLAEILELVLPLKCTFGTHVTGYDTITGIDLNEYLGPTNVTGKNLMGWTGVCCCQSSRNLQTNAIGKNSMTMIGASF